jgi:hypothetical protein
MKKVKCFCNTNHRLSAMCRLSHFSYFISHQVYLIDDDINYFIDEYYYRLMNQLYDSDYILITNFNTTKNTYFRTSNRILRDDLIKVFSQNLQDYIYNTKFPEKDKDYLCNYIHRKLRPK